MSEEDITYEVVVSGDQWDHEAFREAVSEVEGAGIDAEYDGDGGREVWQEPAISSDGFSVTTYGETNSTEPEVLDESWWTWEELADLAGDRFPPGDV